MKKGKMGLFTITCMCVGTIIGAGVFGSLPNAVKLAGPAIVLVLVVAVIEVLLRYFPSVSVSSAIPAPSGFYMQLSRLVNPYFGVLQLLQILFNIFVQSLLATVFASYLGLIIPVNATVAAVGVLLLFGTISYFGTSAGAKVQNIMVVVLICALVTYAAMGLPHVKPEYFTLGKAFSMEGVSFTSFGAALGIITGSLLGGFVSVYYADRMKNPHKNIVLSFILSTAIAGFLYILMGIVTAGIVPSGEISSLGDMAKLFMPTPVWYFFIIGGALCAIATTINGSIIGSLQNLGVFAKDRVLPDLFVKRNKYDISVAALLVVVLGDIFVVSFGLPISTLMSVSSALGIIIAMAQFIPAIKMPKRYPNCHRNAAFKIPLPLMYCMIVFSGCFCIYELYSMVISSTFGVWIGVAITLALGYIYFFIRKSYLQKKGVDLLAIMSEPYGPWEEKEAEFAEKATQ